MVRVVKGQSRSWSECFKVRVRVHQGHLGEGMRASRSGCFKVRVCQGQSRSRYGASRSGRLKAPGSWGSHFPGNNVAVSSISSPGSGVNIGSSEQREISSSQTGSWSFALRDFRAEHGVWTERSIQRDGSHLFLTHPRPQGLHRFACVGGEGKHRLCSSHGARGQSFQI